MVIRLYITCPSYIPFCRLYGIYYHTNFEMFMKWYYRIIHYSSTSANLGFTYLIEISENG